jgi:hypothetical protein
MKTLFLLTFMFSLSAFSQDPKAFISAFDKKVYSLKSKGVQDFVVDLESSKLTQQMNEQMIFGQVKELIFRVYWTANPERLAVEIIGLPEGFKEIKEELKLNVTSMLDNLIPLGVEKRFAGYKISKGSKPGVYFAKDQTGVAPIPGYILRFDSQDKLSEIIGKRPVGSFHVKTNYIKENFTDGKWALKTQITTTAESGQRLISSKEIFYSTTQGMGVVSQVNIRNEQRWDDGKTKPVVVEETMNFKNYKINTGDGLKYFLSDSSQ